MYFNFQLKIKTKIVCNNCFQFDCAKCYHMHQLYLILINTNKMNINMKKMTGENTYLI